MDRPQICGSKDTFDHDTVPGTRFHTLLHSNEPPTWSDFPAIRAATSETEQRLASVEQEILRLNNRLVHLETERTRLRDHHHGQKSILSPLRRLPSEMLSEIFLWTLPAIDEGMFRDKFDVGGVPWVLTHVCSRWRAVAISTPSLWSLIMVLYPRDLVCPRAALETQIHRSPMLKVHFYGSIRCEESPQIETLQFLMQYSARWEELSIGLTQQLLPFLPSLHDQIPALRKLWIEWEDELDDSEEVTHTIDSFQGAGSLVEFGVCRMPASILPPANRSLTHYYADAGWDTHWGILNGNPGLIEAHVYVANRNPNWPVLGQAVELLQLRRLCVSNVEALAYIKMPILEQVTIDLWKDATMVPALDRFITDSSRNIRSLGLRGVPQAPLAAQIIQRYPLLTELAILIFEPPSNEDGADDFNPRDTANALFTHLEDAVAWSVVDAEAPPPVASRLSHIHFAFTSATDWLQLIDYECYVGMLESLWEKPDRRALRAASLAFNCRQEPDVDVQSRLDSLQSLKSGNTDLLPCFLPRLCPHGCVARLCLQCFNLNAVETRLDALLRSNVPGASSDFPAVESAISDIDLELAPLNEDILQLQARLYHLEWKRDDLMRRRSQHKAIVSALRRMPTETLGEIFMWTLPSVTEVWENPDVFGIKATPWVLTHVCSRWRQIAVSMPALWSLLMILYTEYNFPLPAVELQVQRSKNLRIHLYGTHRRVPGPQVEVLQYLIQHSARWEELSIGLTREMNLILPAVQDRLPSLRRLCLEWDEEEVADDTALAIDYFQSASSLVDLRICRRWRPISYSAPVNQLTRYTADAPWETHRSILSISPALVEAHISVFPVLPDPDPNPERVELSHLRCLYVSHVDLLQYLKVAVLEQVTFRVVSEERDMSPALHRFITDTAGTVRRLGLRGLPDPGLVNEILLRYTSITELAILIFGGDRYQYTEHEFRIPNALISLLVPTPNPDSSPPAPVVLG